VEGALLVDKPPGPTSHDVVAFVRRTLKTSRVGHTGTLDPLATGLLVILVGQATRMAQFLAADEKEYIADVRLGISTPTYDAASIADALRLKPDAPQMGADERGFRLQPDDLEHVLSAFRGTFLQMPPPYSAKKIASVPAYEKARKNQPVDLKPVPVTVRELQVLHPSDIGHRSSDIGSRPSDIDGRDATLIRLRVAASAGFYVRSLAHDIGQALGCGAHLEALRRIRVGGFHVDRGLTLDRVEAEGTAALIPLDDLLGDMPVVTLNPEGVRRAAHGNSLADQHLEKGTCPLFGDGKGDRSVFGKGDRSLFRLRNADGTLLAVAERRPDGLLHPLVVLG
jgi:tRNA pseudouridine55 synthase